MNKQACQSCQKEYPSEQFPTTADSPVCDHWKFSLCAGCITQHITDSVKSSPVEQVPCPEPGCHGHLGYFQMERYAPAAVFERYVDRLNSECLNQVTNFVSCAGFNCNFGCEVDPNTTSWIHCPLCEAKTCVDCKRQWHAGVSCNAKPNANAQDLPPRQPVEVPSKEQVLFQRCPGPNCKARIEKSGGCAHISCVSCGHEFCWDCRADYREILSQGGSAGHNPGCRWLTEPGMLDPYGNDGN